MRVRLDRETPERIAAALGDDDCCQWIGPGRLRHPEPAAAWG
jgi:hypothetical protein